MTLSSMVVSRDAQQISLLQCILGGLHIQVEVVPEPQRARVKLEKSRVDALIVDAETEGSLNFLREMEKQENQNSVPLVIVGPTHRGRDSQDQSSFLFQKPISVEQAVRILLSARNTILERRLHYHRQAVRVPALLSISGNQCQTQIVNLSQGGACLRGAFPADFALPLELQFTLPKTSGPMKLKASLAWADERGNAGVRFMSTSATDHRTLQLWLEQQYFAR
jgi:PilZ domain